MVANLDGVEYYDVDEADGLAEAAFYGVTATPSIVICDENGKEIASWRGETPTMEGLIECLES